MQMRFFKCKHCGQIVAIVKSTNVPIICCGEPMQELKPGTTDGALEKHVPVYTKDGNKVIVNVGAVAHPMLPEHYIEWVAIETKLGNQRKKLEPNQEPKVCFSLCDGDEVVAVYAYCNIHSLYKA